MAEYLHVKVKYLRQMDNGLIKKITEQYLVDAMSFTEAEARVLQEVGEGMREVTMMAVSRSPIKEVVMYGDTDLFFKCKVTYSTLDEATEKEKKVTTYLLVNANDVHEAYERTEEYLKDMLVPFQIPKIEESPIIEVYEYQKQAPKGFVKVSSEMLERREQVKQALGDFYPERLKQATAMLQKRMNDSGKPNPINAVLSFKDEDIDPVTGSMLIAAAAEMVEGSEVVQDCAMESTDPTQGQAVAFDMPEDLLAILDEEGLNLTVGQLQRITEQAEALPQVEFISWMMAVYATDSRVNAEIWEVLND